MQDGCSVGAWEIRKQTREEMVSFGIAALRRAERKGIEQRKLITIALFDGRRVSSALRPQPKGNYGFGMQ